MTILFLDWETRSTVDLKKEGLDNYAKHPTTDILCGAFAIGNEPVRMWSRGEPVPEDVAAHIRRGGIVAAHNISFDRAICNYVGVRYGWPEIAVGQCHDTLAMAYAMALPGSLENASAAVGLEIEKDMAGHRLMLKMCKPKADGAWHETESDLARLRQYCATDLEVERQLYDRLLKLSPAEQDLWVLDQRINNRGVYVDLPTITTAIQVVEKEQARLNAAMRKVTGGAVATCTANGQLADWLRYRGVQMPGVAKADVLDALSSGELPDDCRHALTLRQEAAKSSTAKLKAMAQRASSDSRVRGTMQYHGAATGRWAGRGIQVQNFPRPALKQKEIEAAIELLAIGDRDSIDILYGAPMDVIASCLRGMMRAAPGHDMIAVDFSNIESRVLAWLAGAEWKLQAFRDNDAGTGPDIYLVAVSWAYGGNDYEALRPYRQQGKVIELGYGFGGGPGAAFTMAKTYGVNLNSIAPKVMRLVPSSYIEKTEAAWGRDKSKYGADQQAGYFAGDLLKQVYRDKNPEIRQYWYDLENAAINAVLSPGAVTQAGALGREVKFRQKGSFLFCRLPSGRVLTYPYPKIAINRFGREALQYMSVDSVSGKWGLTDTYGGKISENVTQAVARDLLAHGLTTLENSNIATVFHAHDEAVVEVASDWEMDNGVGIVEELLAKAPEWALGLPLAAEGWRGAIYRK